MKTTVPREIVHGWLMTAIDISIGCGYDADTGAERRRHAAAQDELERLLKRLPVVTYDEREIDRSQSVTARAADVQQAIRERGDTTTATRALTSAIETEREYVEQFACLRRFAEVGGPALQEWIDAEWCIPVPFDQVPTRRNASEQLMLGVP